MMEGARGFLRLERDPENEYDSNAIKVISHWQDSTGTWHQGRIGWVPRNVAAKIAARAPERQLYAAIELLIPPRAFKSPGIRMDIWTHRKVRQRASAIQCGTCGLVVHNSKARFCSHCGAEVIRVSGQD
jgi:hypothetical protein